MKPLDAQKENSKAAETPNKAVSEAAPAAPAAEEQANFANGQEKLHLLMADDRIPAGAKLY